MDASGLDAEFLGILGALQKGRDAGLISPGVFGDLTRRATDVRMGHAFERADEPSTLKRPPARPGSSLGLSPPVPLTKSVYAGAGHPGEGSPISSPMAVGLGDQGGVCFRSD